MLDLYPQVLKLLRLALTVPVSSVDCERGFSKQNLIKTKLRASLKTESVSNLMMMALDTPELDTMENFNFHRAFTKWCEIKEHVNCRQ